MSLFLLVNNLHFTVELVGALVFFIMAWLAVDAYAVGRQTQQLLRVIGFSLIGVWQIMFALALSSDLANIAGSIVYILGILIVAASFLAGPRTTPLLPAVLLIPAFASVSSYMNMVSAIGLAIVALLSFRQFKAEFNQSLRFFWIGFLALSLGTFTFAFFGRSMTGNLSAYALQCIGFVSLAMWVWQYLRLRLRESVVLIFISLTLLIATIVTMAFSAILMGKIEAETRASLTIDTRVVELAVSGLLEEARVKAELLALRGDITSAIEQKNSAKLEGLLSNALGEEKLGFLLVTDKSGTVLLRAHALSRHGDSIGRERAVESALTGEHFATIESSPGEKFSIRAAVPLYQKEALVGVLVAGFPLDNVFADKMKKITGLEMSIYEGDDVVATTALASDGRSRLSGISVDDTSVKEAVLEKGSGTIARVALRGEQFLASYLPLHNADGKIIGMLSASKPQQEIIALANATNRLTLIAVMSLLLVLALPLYFLTRRLLGEAS